MPTELERQQPLVPLQQSVTRHNVEQAEVLGETEGYRDTVTERGGVTRDTGRPGDPVMLLCVNYPVSRQGGGEGRRGTRTMI